MGLPTRVAVVKGGSFRSNPPPTVTFGSSQGNGEALLLHFDPLPRLAEVRSAFLLLQPAAEAIPHREDVEVFVFPTLSSWPAGLLNTAPQTSSQVARALARSRPPTLLRIDVTEWVRRQVERGAPGEGLLIAHGEGSKGSATYRTGVDGALPRLEIYSDGKFHE